MLRMAERLHLILRSERSERLEGRSPRGIGSGSLGAVPQAPALRPGEGRLLPRGFAAAGASPSGRLRARPAVGTGPGGAPDPVDIALRHVRNLVVDHVADAVDVDAAGCDIGRDEHARGP